MVNPSKVLYLLFALLSSLNVCSQFTDWDALFKTIKTSGGSTVGGGRSPPRLGPKKFIARPKNTHLQTPFCIQNVLKLTYSNLEFQNFPGEDPRTPLFKGRGGKGKGGEDREGKGK